MVTPSNDNLYAPPRSTVADVAADTDTDKATRGSRLGAVLIDSLIFAVPFMPSYMMVWPRMMSQARAGGPASRANPFAVWAAIGGTGVWFYIGALAAIVTLTLTTIFVYRNGQTIGKKLLGIKVVRKDGSKATLGRIFWLRYLLNTAFMLIPLVGSLYSIVDSLFIFGKEKRCVHDYLADTIVIRA